MKNKMLKFVDLKKETPPKREVEKRRKDFNEISNNLLFLSCRFDLSANNPSETNNITLNKDFIALTQQNITHNIIILFTLLLNFN